MFCIQRLWSPLDSRVKQDESREKGLQIVDVSIRVLQQRMYLLDVTGSTVAGLRKCHMIVLPIPSMWIVRLRNSQSRLKSGT